MLLRGDVTENLWGFLRLAGRRVAGEQPTPSGHDRGAIAAAREAIDATPSPAAATPRPIRPQRVDARQLAMILINSLGKGEHRFRALKDDFDGSCEELGIASVSDKRFATWLQEAGCKRRRIKRENVTVYQVPARASSTRSARRGAKASPQGERLAA